MSVLADELMQQCDAIVHRWYETWRGSSHPHRELSEAEVKDHLSPQLKHIGEELRNLETADDPEQLWQKAERLDPEVRVSQEVPIEEVVQEYMLLVDTVRDWIEERKLEVPFQEYSYFYRAVFELVAESVRRFTRFQSERVARDRAEYLAGLAHQMRNPVTSLSMQVQLLERSSQGADPKLLKRMRRSVNRLNQQIGGVMRLERFKPEDLPVKPRTIHPAEVISSLLDDYRLEAESKGLRLEASIDAALQMSVDPELFIDVAGNLVHNAIKYTHSGFVRVEAEEHPGEVLFKVCDSGPGIPPDRKRKLFNAVLPGREGGAGIGLMVACRAITAQGGTIGVESEPGQGAVFWFRLSREVAARDGDGAETFEEQRSASELSGVGGRNGHGHGHNSSS